MNPESRYWAVLCTLFSLCLAIQIQAAPWDHGPIEVSSSGRYLQHTDGTPFLWIGDTAWDLVQKLTKNEVETYFANRKAKGYTVIQITGLGQDSGLVKGINENGSVPFTGGNPYQRNASFWNYVDWVVETAAAHDLYLLFLPTWGYYGSVFSARVIRTNPISFGRWAAILPGAPTLRSGTTWLRESFPPIHSI